MHRADSSVCMHSVLDPAANTKLLLPAYFMLYARRLERATSVVLRFVISVGRGRLSCMHDPFECPVSRLRLTTKPHCGSHHFGKR